MQGIIEQIGSDLAIVMDRGVDAVTGKPHILAVVIPANLLFATSQRR